MLVLCPLTQFEYQLKRSARRQTIGLRITEHGLVVHAPIACPQPLIETLLLSKKAWVQRHLARLATVEAVDHIENGELPYLGKLLKLQIVRDEQTAVTLEHETLWLQISKRVKIENYRKQIEKSLSQWYEQQAFDWFTERVKFWLLKFQTSNLPKGQRQPAKLQAGKSLQLQRIAIKHWQRKWGTCNNQGIVSFNWRLMMAPSWVADYVIVHELAHLTYMDHSPRFWQLVSAIYPNYKDAERFLRDHQQQLKLSQ